MYIFWLLLFSHYVWLFLTPMTCSTPGFPALHHLWKFAQTHVRWVTPSNPLTFCYPLLLLPSVFPSIRVFSRWPKHWSFSFSNQSFQRLFRVGLTDLISMLSKGLPGVFSTIQKHKFFSDQPSVWSNFHIHTWLLEKP